jgi:hypothetical protein
MAFDMESFLESFGDDLSNLADVVKLCRDVDIPRLLEKLRDGIEGENGAVMANAAHGLKGVVAALHAGPAISRAVALEKVAKAGQRDAVIKEADAMVAELRRVVIALEDLAGIDHRAVAWT